MSDIKEKPETQRKTQMKSSHGIRFTQMRNMQNKKEDIPDKNTADHPYIKSDLPSQIGKEDVSLNKTSSFLLKGSLYSIRRISQKTDRMIQQNVSGGASDAEQDTNLLSSTLPRNAIKTTASVVYHYNKRKKTKKEPQQKEFSEYESNWADSAWEPPLQNANVAVQEQNASPSVLIKTKPTADSRSIRTKENLCPDAKGAGIRLKKEGTDAAKAAAMKKAYETKAKRQMMQKKAVKQVKKKSAEKTAATSAKLFADSNLVVIFGVILVFLLLVIIAILLLLCGSQNAEKERQRQNTTSATAAVSESVLQYENLITIYAEEYGIGRYVPLIEAVMMQESGGLGTNVMQVSFSSVSNAEESIRLGVAYLRECLEQARVTSPTDMDRIKVALQGYNYGTNYISWVWNNYNGEYSEENALAFSVMQRQSLGWSVYGDPEYVSHVMRYYNFADGSDLQFLTDGAEFAWPVPGHMDITSGYGSRWGTMHKGIDISDEEISGVPVVASRSGTVTRADNTCTHNYPKNSSCGCGGGYGNRVEISHDDGTSTLYGHMVTITVSVGQTVQQGQVIGYVGSTGYSTGYHLHFEIKQNGVQVDPMPYL